MTQPPHNPMASDQFDDRNAFLHFVLGLVSVSESMVAAVSDVPEPGPPVRTKPASTARHGGSLLR